MGIYLAPRLKRFYLEQKSTTKDKQALSTLLFFIALIELTLLLGMN